MLLTGGIGSGKSAVARILSEAGIPVYDSDSRTKALYDSDPSLVEDMQKAIGMGIVTPEGKLDRKALAGVIFSDPSAMEKIEGIVHPRVKEDFLLWKDSQKGDIAVMESAIALSKPLFRDTYEKVILVTAPLQARVERVMKRDSSSREAVIARVQSQSVDPLMADAVINNDLDMEALRYRTLVAFRVAGCPIRL